MILRLLVEFKQIDFAATMDQVDVTIKDLNQITCKVNDSEGSLGASK